MSHKRNVIRGLLGAAIVALALAGAVGYRGWVEARQVLRLRDAATRREREEAEAAIAKTTRDARRRVDGVYKNIDEQNRELNASQLKQIQDAEATLRAAERRDQQQHHVPSDTELETRKRIRAMIDELRREIRDTETERAAPESSSRPD